MHSHADVRAPKHDPLAVGRYLPAVTTDDMDAEIRKAHASDVDAIAALGSAVVPAHYTPILGADGAQGQLAWWTPQRMASAVERGRVHVALVGDTIVGVSETGEMGNEQVIWKLYLAPDFRGRSLGVKLLRQAIGVCCRFG